MSRNEALQFINVAHFFDHYFLLVFPTAALAIAPAWDMDYADVLFLGSPVYILFALGTLPAGWLGDRMDRMTLIGVFFLGCGMSSICVALAGSTLAMSIALGSMGLFAAIYHPVGLALVTQIGVRKGRALAVNGVYGNLGLAGAAVVTGILASQLGWQAAFYCPGGLSVLIGLVVFWRNRGSHVSPQEMATVTTAVQPSGSRKTQIRIAVIVGVSALFGGLIFNAVTISLPKFFDERLVGPSNDLAWVGASASLVFAVAAFAQLPVGECLDRIGARPVLVFLLGAQVISMLFLATATGAAAMFLALSLVAMVFAEIPITTWLLGHYLEPGIRSRAVSFEYTLSLGVGSVAVPVIATLHSSGIGFDQQFLLLAGAAIAVFVAALFLPKQS